MSDLEGQKLSIVFKEKDIVKALGAKYNVSEKYWYIPIDHKNPFCFEKWIGDDTTKKTSSAEKRRRDDGDDDVEGHLEISTSSCTSTIQQHVKKKCVVGSKLTLPVGMQPVYITSDSALVKGLKGLKQRLRQVCDSQVIRAGGLLYMSLDVEWTVRSKGEAQVSTDGLTD